MNNQNNGDRDAGFFPIRDIMTRFAADAYRAELGTGRVVGFSRWYENKAIQAYLRYGEIFHPTAGRVLCVTISNVSVAPDFRRNGIFTQLRRQVEAFAYIQHAYTCVENVINPILDPYLLRHKYQAIENGFGASSYYKNTRPGAEHGH